MKAFIEKDTHFSEIHDDGTKTSHPHYVYEDDTGKIHFPRRYAVTCGFSAARVASELGLSIVGFRDVLDAEDSGSIVAYLEDGGNIFRLAERASS